MTIIPGISSRHVTDFHDWKLNDPRYAECDELSELFRFPNTSPISGKIGARRSAHRFLNTILLSSFLSGSLGLTISRFADYARRHPSRPSAEIHFLGRKIESISGVFFSAEANCPGVLLNFSFHQFFFRQLLIVNPFDSFSIRESCDDFLWFKLDITYGDATQKINIKSDVL